MGWSIGYDQHWKRDIGYEVPAICDHPGCNTKIDRGLSHVCGGEPHGGDDGCGLFFCDEHLYVAVDTKRVPQLCECCINDKPFFTPKQDCKEWTSWKLSDESWQQWRDENPEEVAKLKTTLDADQPA